MSSTQEIYAGIDVSKARLDVASRPTGDHFDVANEQAGIDSLVGRPRATCPALVVLERPPGASSAPSPPLWPPLGYRWRL